MEQMNILEPEVVILSKKEYQALTDAAIRLGILIDVRLSEVKETSYISGPSEKDRIMGREVCEAVNRRIAELKEAADG